MLIVELAIGYVFYNNIKTINRAEQQANDLEQFLRTNTRYVANGESAERGYLLTGDSRFLQNFKVDLVEIHKNNARYDSLVPSGRGRIVGRIEEMTERKVKEMSRVIELYQTGETDSALDIVKISAGRQIVDSIRAATFASRAEITNKIKQKKEREGKLFDVFFGLISLLVFINIFLVWFIYKKFREYTENLRVMVTTLQINNERMSKFTAMSYHELKTPLRSISGFAQLLKMRCTRGSMDSEASDFVKYITEGVNQMDEVIRRMREQYLNDPK
jgi:CHASE3 domain sensor protein